MTVVEDRSNRLAIAEDAGLGHISLLSVLAGALVSYGAFVVLAGLVTAVAGAFHFDANLTNRQWRQMGIAGGILAGLALFLSYLFGGHGTRESLGAAKSRGPGCTAGRDRCLRASLGVGLSPRRRVDACCMCLKTGTRAAGPVVQSPAEARRDWPRRGRTRAT